MNTQNPHASRSANAPILPASTSPEIVEAYEDLGPCCVQWMPASSLGFYLKFLASVLAVFGLLGLGIYMLLDRFAR